MNNDDVKKLEVSHQIQMEEEDNKVSNQIELDTFRSCCFEIRLQFFLLISKLIVSVIILTLCSYQLITDKDSEIQSLYSGLIGLILGSYLKN